MPVYVIGATFDEHRNSSRVFEVPPTALRDATRALRRFRARNPAHAAWIEEGAPNLTAEEHLRRFGCPYQRGRREENELPLEERRRP